MGFCAAIYVVERSTLERFGGIVALLHNGGFTAQMTSVPKGVRQQLYAVGRSGKPRVSIYAGDATTCQGRVNPNRCELQVIYQPTWLNTWFYRPDPSAAFAFELEAYLRKVFGDDIATPVGAVAEGYDADGRRLKEARPESASVLGMDIILEISVPVVTQVRGDPARAWGVKPGDRLAYIDGRCTRDMTRRELFENLTPNCNRMNVVRGPILIGINCSETHEA